MGGGSSFPAPLKQISGTSGRVKLPGLGAMKVCAGLLAVEGSFYGLSSQRRTREPLHSRNERVHITFTTTATTHAPLQIVCTFL